MKRLINLAILILGLSFVLIVISGIVNFKCIFKLLLGISCPGCGLTRGFRSIIKLDFITATKYNILSVPLFIIGILIFTSLILDIIKNDNKTLSLINNFFKNYYIQVIFIVIITMIINNIIGI